MALADQFNKSKSSSMINTVMKKADNTEMDGKKRSIPLDMIDLNKDNEHIFGYTDIDFLAMTIEENGFNGAIEVWAKKDGRYEISSGHRRYLAMKKLGKKEIPCIVYENVPDDIKAKKLILSNIHNRDLTPLRKARAIQYYSDHVLKDSKKYGSGFNKRDELKKEFNISDGQLQNYLSLLKLIPEFQEYTDRNGFPYTNFLKICKLDESMQKELYHTLISVAEDGDISTLSGVIINQYVQKMLIDKENQEKETINKIKKKQIMEQANNNEVEQFQNTPTGSFQKNISTFSSFDDEQYLDEPEVKTSSKMEEERDDSNNVGGELKYLIHRIEGLLTGVYTITKEDKEECAKLLDNIVNKISD